MKKYLIIGNGVAGTTAAEEIRKNDPEGIITVISTEKTPFYSRIKLPDYVAGEVGSTDIVIKKDQWYKDNRVNLQLETTITDIDKEKKQAKDASGNVFEYDSLLIATGSTSFVPPVNGNSKEKVFVLRDLKDADAVVSAAETASNVVAIGGGLLGLEAAYALIKRGLNVTVVEFFDRLLPRQVDGKGALLLQKILESQNFMFRLGAKTKEITGGTEATGVQLESGENLLADMVLFSAGVRPNLSLANSLKLETDRGVTVDSRMETSFKGIFAAGDVAEFNKTNFCIWPEAQEQGKVAGANMAGGKASFDVIAPSNRLKVSGIDLASAGDIDADNELESEVEEHDQVYRKLVKKEGKLVGCIMIGDTTGFSRLVKQLKQK